MKVNKSLKIAAIIAGFVATSAFAISGGVKVYPMNLSGVGVGVPKKILLENNSDTTTFISTSSENDTIIIFPPLIEELKPGEKAELQVAFISQPTDGSQNKDKAYIRIGDNQRFTIGVKGQ